MTTRAASVPARVVRGSVLALVGTALAFGGHAFAATGHAGQHATHAPLVLVIALIAMAGCALLSDRVWSLRALFTALVGVQIGVHAGLWLASQDGSASLCSAVASANTACSAATPIARASGYGLSITMVVAHIAAAALTALILRRGELVFWRIVALFTRWLVIAMPIHTPLHVKPRIAATPRSTIRGALDALAESVSRRGPPSLVTA